FSVSCVVASFELPVVKPLWLENLARKESRWRLAVGSRPAPGRAAVRVSTLWLYRASFVCVVLVEQVCVRCPSVAVPVYPYDSGRGVSPKQAVVSTCVAVQYGPAW
ncbi:hypothetical protein CSUI_009521, partial [Cystoisospora suis]